MNLNKAFVLGNVTRDPEVRSLPSGQQVASFGIATNRFYTDSAGEKKQDVEFHNIVCFGKLADISSRYLNKGSLILIEGRIKTRNWTNAQGIKQYRTEIIAEALQLGPKGSGGGMSSGYNSNHNRASFADNKPASNNKQTNEDIPVIEENYAPPAQNNEENYQSPKARSSSFEDKPTDEIDVKDIPF